METLTNQEQLTQCKIRIHYDEAIRCIDLENFLYSLRMIYQHLLAEKTSLKTKDFTNVMQIKGIEKGSIVIDMLCNLQNIDLTELGNNLSQALDIVSILQLLDNSQNLPDKIHTFISRLKSSIQSFVKIDFEKTEEITTIKINKDGEMEITTHRKQTSLKIN